MRRQLIGILLAVVSAGGAAGEGARSLLAEESAGLLPIAGESLLRIEGMVGTVVVAQGKPGELRFGTRALQPRAPAPPLALWQDGATLILTVPAGSPPSRHAEVRVPPGLRVEVALSDATVSCSGLDGGLRLAGERLVADVQSVAGHVEIDVTAGTAQVRHAGGDLTLRGRDLKASVEHQSGRVLASLIGSELHGTGLRDELDADLQDTVLVLEQQTGPVQLRAHGGSARIVGMGSGGVLSLTGTPLDLERGAGDIEIQSDAEISFKEMEADIHVDGYGGAVTGRGNTGLVEVKTNGAVVGLEEIAGGVRIEGDGLRVGIKGTEGEVLVYATGSTVGIESARGAVTVENEDGDVTVKESAQMVQVTSSNGDVRLLRLAGPARVKADGSLVQVSWSVVTGDRHSSIENEGGDVQVELPSSGTFRVEAETRSGTVQSDVPWLQVNEGATSAVGGIGRVHMPLVRIEAYGDVLFRTIEGSPGGRDVPPDSADPDS